MRARIHVLVNDDESAGIEQVVALRGSVPPVWKHMFAENIEDVRMSVRRHCGDRISDSLTSNTLVNVKYKEQLKDIVDELQAVRAYRLLSLSLSLSLSPYIYMCVRLRYTSASQSQTLRSYVHPLIHQSVELVFVCHAGRRGSTAEREGKELHV